MKTLPLSKRITKKTFFQCLILGLIVGPIIWALGDNHSFLQLIWSIFAMFIAPIIVDLMRPTYIVN